MEWIDVIKLSCVSIAIYLTMLLIVHLSPKLTPCEDMLLQEQCVASAEECHCIWCEERCIKTEDYFNIPATCISNQECEKRGFILWIFKIIWVYGVVYMIVLGMAGCYILLCVKNERQKAVYMVQLQCLMFLFPFALSITTLLLFLI